MTFPPHRSAPLSNQQQQVRLVVEEDAFEPGFTTRVGSADCLYRKLWDVAFYSPQARLVSLNELTSSVPFVCVASAEKSEGVKREFKNDAHKVTLHPVTECSFEFPYGKKARVWVSTEHACYQIMSVAAGYVSLWMPFHDMACFAGHVINILLNYEGPMRLVKLVARIARLCSKLEYETYTLLCRHRDFIYKLLATQSLDPAVRKSYLALHDNDELWTHDWNHHVRVASEKPTGIISFFRPKAVEQDTAPQEPASLVLSEHDDAIVESPLDTTPKASPMDSAILSPSVATLLQAVQEKVAEPKDLPPSVIALAQEMQVEATGVAILPPVIVLAQEDAPGVAVLPPVIALAQEDAPGVAVLPPVIALAQEEATEATILPPVITLAQETQVETTIPPPFATLSQEMQKGATGQSSLGISPASPLKEMREAIRKRLAEQKSSSSSVPALSLEKLEATEPKDTLSATSQSSVPALSLEKQEATGSKVTPSVAIVSQEKQVAAEQQDTPPVAVSSQTVQEPVTGQKDAPPVAAPSQAEKEAATRQKGPLPFVACPLCGHEFCMDDANSTAAFHEHMLVHQSDGAIDGSMASQLKPSIQEATPDATPLKVEAEEKVQVSLSFTPAPSAPPQAALNSSQHDRHSSDREEASYVDKRSGSDGAVDAKSDKDVDIGVKRHSIVDDSKSLAAIAKDIKRVTLSLPTPASNSQVNKITVDGVDVTVTLADLKKSFWNQSKRAKPTILGCDHSRNQCKFWAGCCSRWFTCKTCHDEAESHKVMPHDIKVCMCMICKTVQKAGSNCVNSACGLMFSAYYCDKCRLWDNNTSVSKQLFHCDRCGICICGQQEKFKHCELCKRCVMSRDFGNHTCLNGLPSYRVCAFCLKDMPGVRHGLPCSYDHSTHIPCRKEMCETSGKCRACPASVSSAAGPASSLTTMQAAAPLTVPAATSVAPAAASSSVSPASASAVSPALASPTVRLVLTSPAVRPAPASVSVGSAPASVSTVSASASPAVKPLASTSPAVRHAPASVSAVSASASPVVRPVPTSPAANPASASASVRPVSASASVSSAPAAPAVNPPASASSAVRPAPTSPAVNPPASAPLPSKSMLASVVGSKLASVIGSVLTSVVGSTPASLPAKTAPTLVVRPAPAPQVAKPALPSPAGSASTSAVGSAAASPVVKPASVAPPVVKPALVAPPVKPAPSVVEPSSQTVKPASPASTPAPPVVRLAPPVVKPEPPVVKPAPPVVKPAALTSTPAPPVVKPAALTSTPALPVVKPAALTSTPELLSSTLAPPVGKPEPPASPARLVPSSPSVSANVGHPAASSSPLMKHALDVLCSASMEILTATLEPDETLKQEEEQIMSLGEREQGKAVRQEQEKDEATIKVPGQMTQQDKTARQNLKQYETALQELKLDFASLRNPGPMATFNAARPDENEAKKDLGLKQEEIAFQEPKLNLSTPSSPKPEPELVLETPVQKQAQAPPLKLTVDLTQSEEQEQSEALHSDQSQDDVACHIDDSVREQKATLPFVSSLAESKDAAVAALPIIAFNLPDTSSDQESAESGKEDETGLVMPCEKVAASASQLLADRIDDLLIMSPPKRPRLDAGPEVGMSASSLTGKDSVHHAEMPFEQMSTPMTPSLTTPETIIICWNCDEPASIPLQQDSPVSGQRCGKCSAILQC